MKTKGTTEALVSILGKYVHQDHINYIQTKRIEDKDNREALSYLLTTGWYLTSSEALKLEIYLINKPKKKKSLLISEIIDPDLISTLEPTSEFTWNKTKKTWTKLLSTDVCLCIK